MQPREEMCHHEAADPSLYVRFWVSGGDSNAPEALVLPRDTNHALNPRRGSRSFNKDVALMSFIISQEGPDGPVA